MNTWYRITQLTNAAGANTAQVDLFDAIGWYGVDAGQFARDLRALDAESITLNINSPGGDVFDGITILNALRQHPATVTANVMGLAASAASFIACGCDSVTMAENSTLMIHDAAGVVIGNAQDMTDMADVLNQISDNVAAIYAAKAGGTAENWRQVMRGEKWYSAQEAVDAGLADSVSKVNRRPAPKPQDGATNSAAPKPRTLADAREALATLNAQPTMTAAAGTEPVNPPDGNPTRKEPAMADTLKAEIAKRLGVTDAAADDSIILAALDESLAEKAEPAAATLPAGVVAIDQGNLETLRADAAAGRQARDELDAQRRDRIVDDALRAGRISAAQRETWRASLDQNEATTAALLNSLAEGTIPVAAKAVTSVDGDDESAYSMYFPKEA